MNLIRRRLVFRLFNSRCYCDENKSLYQKDEEKQKPRQVYGKDYPDWRKPWIQRDGEWYSKLSLFVEKNPSPDALYFMQSLPYLNWTKVKRWWDGMKDSQEADLQKYLVERVTSLGPNLAAIHFFTFRGAAVRLKDSRDWISGDPHELKLPKKFIEGFEIEAIDCANFHKKGLLYEGVGNFQELSFLRWLSLKNNRRIDEWCLDRLAGHCSSHLEYLDISGCQFNAGCIQALSRFRNLNILVITDPGEDPYILSGLSLLEKQNPNLLIKIISIDPALIASAN